MGTAVMIGLMVASTAAEAEEQSQAASSRDAALTEQSKNTQLQYLQKSNSRLSQMQTLLGQQEAMQSTSGLSMGSASFNAIQRSTFDISQKHQANLTAEEKAKQGIISAQKANLNNSLFAQLFGDVGSLAGGVSKAKGGS